MHQGFKLAFQKTFLLLRLEQYSRHYAQHKKKKNLCNINSLLALLKILNLTSNDFLVLL